MKKTVKCILMAMSVCAVSAFAMMTSGCNIKQQINELRCDHVMVDGEVTKEPTCQEEGEMLKECTLCTYTETETLDKLKHAVVILKAVDPTCTKSGLTEGQKCADCEEILVAQKVIAPTGHKVVTDKAVAPTCSTIGKTEGSHCENCDTVFVEQKDVPKLEHVLKEMEAYGATCEEKGFTGGTKCENCDYATEGEIIPALGHSYDDGVVTTEATCEADGEKTYTCATCEGTKVEVIPATGHTFEGSTCTLCGATVNTEKVKISGVWYAKEDMGSLKETSINGKSEPEALNFKSGGYSFTEMKSEVKELLYSNGVSSITVYSICSDVVNQGWQNEVYRYVFIEGEQDVSKAFYNWFTTYFEESEEHISFAIEGTTYYAEAGMTWGEWVESEYNTGVFNVDYNGWHISAPAYPQLGIVDEIEKK